MGEGLQLRLISAFKITYCARAKRSEEARKRPESLIPIEEF